MSDYVDNGDFTRETSNDGGLLCMLRVHRACVKIDSFERSTTGGGISAGVCMCTRIRLSAVRTREHHVQSGVCALNMTVGLGLEQRGLMRRVWRLIK